MDLGLEASEVGVEVASGSTSAGTLKRMNMEPRQGRATSQVVRYVGFACGIGMILGFFEARDLWVHPFPSGLLERNVTWVIWFLAPLIDGAAACLAGVGSWLLVSTFRRKGWVPAKRFLQVHRTAFALAGPSALSMWCVCAMAGSHPASLTLKVATALLLPALGVRLGRTLPLKPLAIALGGAFSILLVGLAIFLLWPAIHFGDALAASPQVAARPNIILVTLDTVRADHLSLYGYARKTTPHLDTWAKRGVVFENAITTTSWTLPSHASIFTGLLPHQHGADWYMPLNTRRWTLAEVLASWGYETAGFTSNFVYGEAGWGLAEGFHEYEDNRDFLLHNLGTLRVGMRIIDPLYRRWVLPDSFERRSAQDMNQDILRWVEHRSRRPYFLFINYFDAHDPYLSSPADARHFGALPPGVIREARYGFEGRGTLHLPEADRQALVAGYDNSLATLDRGLAELLDMLSRLPDWENTVLVITSDHGEGLGEHGGYYHGLDLYNESVRVPLIILGRGVPHGLRIPSAVSTLDVFPTVLRFAGDQNPSRSALQNFWTPGGEPAEGDVAVISELTTQRGFRGYMPQISLRTQDWDFIQFLGGREELYRWREDAGEQNNLAALPEYRPIVAAMHARLCSLVAHSLGPWQGPEYLSALDEPGRPFLSMADSPAELASLPNIPGPRIGEVQDQFPLKAVASLRKVKVSDVDLLHSLPYQ